LDALVIISVALFFVFRTRALKEGKVKMPPAYQGYSDYRDEEAFTLLLGKVLGK
jgi:hypothetical protein